MKRGIKSAMAAMLMACFVTTSMPVSAGDLRLSSSVSEKSIDETISGEMIINIGSDSEVGTNGEVTPEGHKIHKDTKKSTCATKGYTKSYCMTVRNCSEHPNVNETYPLDKNNHENIVKDSVAYCTAEGRYKKYCTACNAVFEEMNIPPRGHTPMTLMEI